VERLVTSYEAKVDDLRRETLRTSAAPTACAQRGIKSPPHIVGEAGLGWDAAMEYVEQAIREANVSADADSDDDPIDFERASEPFQKALGLITDTVTDYIDADSETVLHLAEHLIQRLRVAGLMIEHGWNDEHG
jgi:hypothetical protein